MGVLMMWELADRKVEDTVILASAMAGVRRS